MPKSKKRKGHAKKVQSRKQVQKGKQNAAIKKFQNAMADIRKKQDMQTEVAKQVAAESRADELVIDDPLTLPNLGYDATAELAKATSTEL